jgi:hypothetical protein
VTIHPGDMLTIRRPAWVENRGLRYKHVWPFRVLPPPHGCFAGNDLLQGAAQVNRRGCGAGLILPWDRPIQSLINLEHAGAITVALKLPAVGGWQTVTYDP